VNTNAYQYIFSDLRQNLVMQNIILPAEHASLVPVIDQQEINDYSAQILYIEHWHSKPGYCILFVKLEIASF